MIKRIISGELATIIAIMGLANMAMAVLQPVLPLYLTSIGMVPSIIGLMLAVGMVGMVFGESTGGWVADKLGLKIPLSVGTFICAPLVLSFILASGTPSIFLIFLFWGVVRSAIFGPARGYIGNTASLSNKATLIAVYMASQSVARSIGSLASGFIADNLGYSGDFYFSAGISILAGTLVFVGLKKIPLLKHDIPAVSVSHTLPPSPDRPKVNYRLFIIQCVIVILFLLGGGINSFLPLLAKEVVGVEATQVGILFTIGGLVNTIMLIPLGRLADRMDKRTLMVLGLLLGAVGMAGIAYTRTYPLLVLFTVINNISFAMYTPAAVALLSNTIPAYWQSTGMGIYGAAEDVGIIIGSSAAGFIWTAWGPSSAYLIGMASSVLGAIVCLVFIKGGAVPKGAGV